ncbi:prepilin-type N-terminal cleavage/methylation domain-containing protein [Herbaspirillum sp. HC18]|nr:prepilin-type N-terminal cleavage/methylation domain-containing protein [Herbaspirillum sp. HC18]
MIRRRGFTLIELLVAISVLAVVAVLGWRGLDTIIRSRMSLNQELEQTRGLQLAFAQMQSDCSQIARPEDLGGRQWLSAQPGRLTLVRMVFAENQPSRVQVVAYRMSNGVLTRRESVPTRDLKEVDSAWTAAISDSAALPPVVLHSSVDDMAIRVWGDRNGWRDASAAPPPTQGSDAERITGVEVSLRLRNRQDSLVKVFLLGAA